MEKGWLCLMVLNELLCDFLNGMGEFGNLMLGVKDERMVGVLLWNGFAVVLKRKDWR